MSIELIKRFITSFFLLIILFFSYFNNYVLSFTLTLITTLSLLEFKNMMDKIFIKPKNIFIIKLTFLLVLLSYLIIFSLIVWNFLNDLELKILILYFILICVVTDVGGLIFGKIFKGKKLTSISPNKTYSGLIGAYFFSFILLYFFFDLLNLKIYQILIITFFICSFAQLGDLFFSYLKRKAKIKDTGTILPGHGGILDRIDGILIGVPIGALLSLLL